MKPGYLTTEFWLSLAAAIAPYFAGALSPTIQATVGTVAAGAYAISRGLAKQNAS